MIRLNRRSKANTRPKGISDFDPVGLLFASAAYLLAFLVTKGLLFGLSLLLSHELSFDQDVVALASGDLALFLTSRARLTRAGGESGSHAATFLQTLKRSICLSVVALLGAIIILGVTGMGAPNEAEVSVSRLNRVLALMLSVCVAPIAEETFFRGLLLGGLLARLHAYQAVALSALVFSIAHLQFETLLLHAWLGLLLGFGYARWRSLTTVIVSHSIWNLYWSLAVH